MFLTFSSKIDRIVTALNYGIVAVENNRILSTSDYSPFSDLNAF